MQTALSMTSHPSSLFVHTIGDPSETHRFSALFSYDSVGVSYLMPFVVPEMSNCDSTAKAPRVISAGAFL